MSRPPLNVPAWWVLLARGAVAAVWVYEGLVAKLLGTRADEAAILDSVPLVGGPVLGVVIGVGELVLAAAVLSGRLPRLVASAQTLVLVAFNAGGLLLAGEHIADAGQLLVTNAALLVLAWGAALAAPAVREPVAVGEPA